MMLEALVFAAELGVGVVFVVAIGCLGLAVLVLYGLMTRLWEAMTGE